MNCAACRRVPHTGYVVRRFEFHAPVRQTVRPARILANCGATQDSFRAPDAAAAPAEGTPAPSGASAAAPLTPEETAVVERLRSCVRAGQPREDATAPLDRFWLWPPAAAAGFSRRSPPAPRWLLVVMNAADDADIGELQAVVGGSAAEVLLAVAREGIVLTFGLNNWGRGVGP
jgi:hypothetical protein